jgi:hypothetical protein
MTIKSGIEDTASSLGPALANLNSHLTSLVELDIHIHMSDHSLVIDILKNLPPSLETFTYYTMQIWEATVVKKSILN